MATMTRWRWRRRSVSKSFQWEDKAHFFQLFRRLLVNGAHCQPKCHCRSLSFLVCFVVFTYTAWGRDNYIKDKQNYYQQSLKFPILLQEIDKIKVNEPLSCFSRNISSWLSLVLFRTSDEEEERHLAAWIVVLVCCPMVLWWLTSPEWLSRLVRARVNRMSRTRRSPEATPMQMASMLRFPRTSDGQRQDNGFW